MMFEMVMLAFPPQIVDGHLYGSELLKIEIVDQYHGTLQR